MDNKQTTDIDKGDVVTVRPTAPKRFYEPGARWRYADGTVLVIGEDGVARRPEPRVRQSKKARKRARKGKNNG